MRYTAIISTSPTHNIQLDYSGPEAREEFRERCISMAAKWGHLMNAATGKTVLSYTDQEDKTETAPSASVNRLALPKPVMATTLVAEMASLIVKHGDQVVLYAIPDEGAFNIELPRFDTDGAGDNCFIM